MKRVELHFAWSGAAEGESFTLSFSESEDLGKAVAKALEASPDFWHVRLVKSGDPVEVPFE